MSAPSTIVSVKSIALKAPGRGEDLLVKISAPTTGGNLPIILFAHGNGSSLDGYSPLTDFWAAHGFVVIQPTFLDSRTVGLTHDDPRKPRIWRYRVEDMKRILDKLD
ncbi:alpha/beta hydrolase family protein, partial [Paenibacillus tundrae]|uniref:alpha/beta hydrolase family protein n=1 Tax=Paenibacillus tundrae TaxID=528187 RepID=UPI0039B659A0